MKQTQALFERLGKYLQEARKSRNLSQIEVAQALGYGSAQFISNWERGVSAPPIPKLRQLIHLYRIPADVVLRIILEEQEKALRKALTARKRKAGS